MRPSVAKLRQLIRTVASEAETRDEMAECIAVALSRDHLVPALKQYVNTTRRFKYREYIEACEEWERSQPRGTSCYRKGRTSPVVQNSRHQSSPYVTKKPVTCFSCGKAGHMAKEYRSRVQAERVTALAVAETPAVTASAPRKANVTCFTCHLKGHKSPQCPSKKKGNRKVKLPKEKLEILQHEELFGFVGDYGMSITCHTGAGISVVRRDCVGSQQFPGVRQVVKDFHGASIEGEVCNIAITISGRKFHRSAVAIPRELMNWTPCFHVPYKPTEDMEFVLQEMEKKF